ncbi:hypothetical protein ELE36_10920 [Pseudolysobacter antarcticus]|uniref:DUF4350 domain-containing protein n=1 Tax=Pseudolysobacter antarcticus TaxID=2511995 RepID=A0A411HJY2_9GAMM|nr:DUF4350 domain-containing protein [Pseudolysobacter antarcticus]QBB70825.1 hypothetical protein ELE36_10920 [Pseudolysobacter antarcticus]
MNRRGVLIGLLIVLALAALIGWWLYTFERVPQEINLPMRGEASYNPLFALKKTLQAQHIDVTTHGGLNVAAMHLQPGDALVLNADIRTLSEDQVDDLWDWVVDGGHLLFALPPASEGRAGELLESLDLKVKKHSSCLSLREISTNTDVPDKKAESKTGIFDDDESDADPANKFDSKTSKEQFCSSFRFQVEAKHVSEFAWLWGSEKNGYIFGRHTRGKGDWLVAASLDFLTNRRLNESDNATLAWQVIAPALGKGRVHLVYAADVPPWYVLMVVQGWPILLPLLFALLAWLWARSQRFGPLLLPAIAHRRALLEHVQAAGDFAISRGRGPALYEATRRAFLERLRRRDPAIAALRGEAMQQALATQYGFSTGDLQQALNPVDLNRPLQFFTTIKTLLSLRSKL